MNATLSEKEMNQVIDILEKELMVSREQILPESKIRQDLGADSLDDVQIIMAIEEQFEVSIPDEVTDRIVTVEDLCNELAALLVRT
jgi:acyl carrier protein